MAKRIKGRPSKYLKTLKNNPYWDQVKRQVRLRDNWTCQEENCGRKTNLETHHIRYRVHGISILGKELKFLYCLTLLCSDCHKKVHKDINHKWNPINN